MPTQGAALGYEQVGPSGRSLSERVNCDIIAYFYFRAKTKKATERIR
jgi:hypothetical protein